MSSMLEVKNIQVAYGKIIAVKDVSVTVEKGEIVTLIGSNGAGKSTNHTAHHLRFNQTKIW